MGIEKAQKVNFAKFGTRSELLSEVAMYLVRVSELSYNQSVNFLKKTNMFVSCLVQLFP